MAFWFNVKTREVEEDGATSRKEDLMGPYETREAAENAFASAAERTEAWDEEDRRRAEEDGKEPDDEW
ncbi:MAG: methionine aminopeptidase [Mobilicoccus sp.]|nr:methionine aminopeptidase [Mobilicoccus sp.]